MYSGLGKGDFEADAAVVVLEVRAAKHLEPIKATLFFPTAGRKGVPERFISIMLYCYVVLLATPSLVGKTVKSVDGPISSCNVPNVPDVIHPRLRDAEALCYDQYLNQS